MLDIIKQIEAVQKRFTKRLIGMSNLDYATYNTYYCLPYL